MKDIFSCYLQMMLNIGLWKYRIFSATDPPNALLSLPLCLCLEIHHYLGKKKLNDIFSAQLENFPFEIMLGRYLQITTQKRTK